MVQCSVHIIGCQEIKPEMLINYGGYMYVPVVKIKT